MQNSKQSPLHKPCHHVLRVILTIACSRHDKSENSMRGKQREGRGGEGAQLHSPIYDNYLRTGYEYSQSNVSNKLLTNVR